MAEYTFWNGKDPLYDGNGREVRAAETVVLQQIDVFAAKFQQIEQAYSREAAVAAFRAMFGGD